MRDDAERGGEGMTRLLVMALTVLILAAVISACEPVRKPPPLPQEIAPKVLPHYRCDRADKFWCQLAPNWREV